MGDIIVIAVLILCVALIVRNMIKTRKKGGCAGCSGCSGGCSTCAKYMANNTKK
ncbi:MAG: FeoB-associated Cys-rich membrane protein [Oscillospiraceae bacterium]|nr:FeoB-associated Cys-rich membrane protein [Oscillospiraceae bacterium]MBR6607257.1 FeoB-associated Cys-rich membrane protein [Oscillospiraceae bacterium]